MDTMPAMQLRVTGELRLTLVPTDSLMSDDDIHRHGIVVFQEKNIIVDVGMQVFSRMLGGGKGSATVGGLPFGSVSDIAVSSMRLGKSTSAPTPSASDTIGVTVLTTFQPLLTVLYPTVTSVRFAGLVPSTEEEGTTFTEEALYLANGMLFAKRLIIPGIYKQAGLALQVDHTFNFERG